jgi:hypothetical protein
VHDSQTISFAAGALVVVLLLIAVIGAAFLLHFHGRRKKL